MDRYYPKTRRPITSTTPRKNLPRTPTKTPRPTTPTNARIERPLKPPPAPVKKKLKIKSNQKETNQLELPIAPVRRKLDLQPDLDQPESPATPVKRKSELQQEPEQTKSPSTPIKRKLNLHTEPGISELKLTPIKRTTHQQIKPSELLNLTKLNLAQPLKPNSTDKIKSGPLQGVSTSLLDLIRAKEAAANAISPEEDRKRDLLGIAPEVVRIVLTVFTASKREVLPYYKIIEKCIKGLKSNYMTPTILDCLTLIDKIVPEWVSVVQISRGKFMRVNKDNYSMPQILEAIKLYKTDCHKKDH